MFRGKCKHCRQAVQKCPTCKGEGSFHRILSGFQSCTTCGGTGSICSKHGKYWT